jgi:hypothetical protein
MFDQDGTYPYIRMLEDQTAGHNDSWAVRWRASVILNGMLSLYPPHPLACNIGLDGSGTHAGVLSMGSENFHDEPVCVKPVPLVHSPKAFQQFARFNRQIMRGSIKDRLIRRLRKLAGA